VRPQVEPLEVRVVPSLFGPGSTFATGKGPVSVVVADVNGDGRPDLVTANFTSNTISVLLGNGNGTFQAAQNLTAGTNPHEVVVADVNGDGRLDIVATNERSNDVSVFLGNGNGTFQAAQNFAVGSYPNGLAVADVNGDGHLDLITANTANATGNTVSVLLGNGNGTFQAAQNFITDTVPIKVAVADVNGDGKLDIVTANTGGTVSVLLGNGNGTFQAATNISVGSGTYPASVAVADLNGDGKLDLVTANNGDSANTVSVLLGNGNGTFKAATNFAIGTEPVGVAVADLNGDGHPDLIATNESSNTVSVLLGNGNGTFLAALNYSTGTGAYSVAVADVNGDGRPDLVVANGGSNNVSVLLNTCPPPGTGSFQAARNFATGTGPYALAVADLNGDHHLDLVTANARSSGTVSVLLGNGNGTFQAPQNFATGKGPDAVAVADVNGDGHPDLITANNSDNTVSVLLGNGNGTFQSAQNFATDTGPVAVAVADVNADGHLDLVTANRGSNTVSVLLGNGDGTFQAAQNFAVGKYPDSVAVADVNGDGHPDLVAANSFNGSGGDTVSVLLGNGNGTFAAAANFATGSAPNSVALADVNRDGQKDIIVANYTSGTVSVLLGNGNGTFQAAANFSTGAGPDSVAVADVSGDGKLDLVTTNIGSFIHFFSTVSVLVGNGNGTFKAAQNFTANSEPAAVAVADVNGDGHPDLITANKGTYDRPGSTVSVLLGNGNGSFQAARLFTAGSYPRSVAVADVNGDGKPDLVIANAYTHGSPAGGTVSVLLGNGNGTFKAARNFATGLRPFSVVVADVNGDGKLDLVTANYTSNTVSVLLGNGNGSFKAAKNFTTGTEPAAVAVGDVNGDGRPDLLVANSYNNTVSVLLGNGNGTFAAAQNFATGARPFAVAVADVNRDGRLDLVTANFTDGTVSVLLGNGNGTFAAATNFTTGPAPRSVAVADVNGDGRPDIVAATYSQVSVLLGNGNGSFKAAKNFATGAREYCIAVADLNGDGKADVVTANAYYVNNVSVLLGKGNGSFQAAVNYTVGTQPSAVAVADLNGDGVLDLAVTDTSNASVAVLVGQRNAATHFQVSAPSSVNAGTAFTITVTALTAGGQTDCNYTGTVRFTSSDPSAVLPAAYTFTLADGGTHTFTVTLNTTGTQTITAIDKAHKTVKGKATVTVASGSALPSPRNSRSGDTSGGSANPGSNPFAEVLAAMQAGEPFPATDPELSSLPVNGTPVGRPVLPAATVLPGTVATTPRVRIAAFTDAADRLPPEADETQVGLRLADLEAFFAAEAWATRDG
jgi:predicted dehydrogenase